MEHREHLIREDAARREERARATEARIREDFAVLGEPYRALERAWNRDAEARMKGDVAVALRAIEEIGSLRRETFLAREHAGKAVYYTQRLRGKIERSEALIRELKQTVRRLEHENAGLRLRVPVSDGGTA